MRVSICVSIFDAPAFLIIYITCSCTLYQPWWLLVGTISLCVKFTHLLVVVSCYHELFLTFKVAIVQLTCTWSLIVIFIFIRSVTILYLCDCIDIFLYWPSTPSHYYWHATDWICLFFCISYTLIGSEDIFIYSFTNVVLYLKCVRMSSDFFNFTPFYLISLYSRKYCSTCWLVDWLVSWLVTILFNATYLINSLFLSLYIFILNFFSRLDNFNIIPVGQQTLLFKFTDVLTLCWLDWNHLFYVFLHVLKFIYIYNLCNAFHYPYTIHFNHMVIWIAYLNC